jgi:Holliday junction resolvase RusA-like endonuclease
VSTFLKNFRTAQALPPQDEVVADYLNSLLADLLDAEGPPPEPVEGLSVGHRREIVKTAPTKTRPTGTPVAVAETWSTLNWVCLLVEIPSAAMQRARFGKKKQEEQGADSASEGAGGQKKAKWEAQAAVFLDSKSKKFQDRVVMACRSLGLDYHLDEAAVHMIAGHNRTFIAWRRRNEDETFAAHLRADTDNYYKNVADALQRARIISNDRGVFRITGEKSFPAAWVSQPTPLAEEVVALARRLHKDGVPLGQVKANLVLTYAEMATLFPGEYHPPRRSAKRMGHAQSKEIRSDAQVAVRNALDAGKTLTEAIAETGATRKEAQSVLADVLILRLRGKGILEAEATKLGINPQGAKKLLQGSPYAKEAETLIRAHRKAARQASKGVPDAVIDAAIEMLRTTPNMTVPEAARSTGAPVGRVRSRLRANPVRPKSARGRKATTPQRDTQAAKPKSTKSKSAGSKKSTKPKTVQKPKKAQKKAGTR